MVASVWIPVRVLGKYTIALFVLFLSRTLSLFAQPEDLPFLHLKSGVGTPATYAEFIYKDRQGFIWLGTEQGLARFNGQTMEPFSQKQGLGGLIVTSPFFEDTVNNLIWFSTYRAVNCYRRNFNDFKSVEIRGVEGRLQLFFQDPQRRLWVRTAEGNAVVLDPSGVPSDAPEQFRQTTPGKIDGATFYAAPDASRQNIAFILSGNSFQSGQGLYYYTVENGGLIPHRVNDKWSREQIVRILPFDHNTVWLICKQKIALYDFKNDKTIREKSVQGYNIYDAVAYGQNELLLATTFGIACYNSIDIRLLYHTDPRRDDRLKKNEIQRLYLDADRILWASHWGGVDFGNLQKVKFKTIGFSELNGKDSTNFAIKSIVELPGGRFWLGSNFVGELRERLPSGQIRSLNLPAPYQGFAADLLYPLRNGQILLSNDKSRSYWYDHTAFLPIRNKGKDLWFSTFCQLSNDTIIGGNASGIYIIRKQQKNGIVTAVGGPFNQVHLVAQDKAGRVFVGQRERVISICNNKNGLTIYDSILVEGELKTFCETSDYLWFGGVFGLIRCDKNNLHHIKHFTIADGLPHNIIYGVLEDSLGRLWMSTQRGLAMLDMATDRIHRFGPADGIQDWEYNTHAYFKDSRGWLWFGGMGGLNVFDPETVHFLEAEPKIVLTDFNINYRPYHQIRNDAPGNVSQITQLHLNHDQNNLFFTFTALEYSDLENIEFQYRLTPADSKPNDTAWTTLRGAQVSFSFSQLPPGKYRLFVKSTNSDGKWLTTPFQMNIFIEIPYWQHPLFILCCIAFAFAVGFWFSNYRKQIQIDKLTAVNKERDRIARDMHDDILKSFGVIRRKLEELSGKPELLGSIIEQIKQVETDTRVVIDAFDFKHDTLLHTIYFTTEKLVRFIEDENVNAIVHQPENIPDMMLSGRQRKNLYFAAQEAVNNALKYSKSPDIQISFDLATQKTGTSLLIVVRDFGIGLGDTKVNPAGFGLGNISSRLKDIGGLATIENAQPGPGVQVTLMLPLKETKP